MQQNQAHAEVEVTISNTQGMHARPVMRFVDLASKYTSDIRVKKEELDVDGKSPMEMMLLEAVQGTRLLLVADGSDADQAVNDLASLINSKFGEET